MSTTKEIKDFPEIDYDAFRDQIGTVDESGNRMWVYPKKPKGRYYNRRKIVSAILLALLFVGPFLKYKGQPFMLFNLLERKFILFGVTFWPQDFHLFVLAMLSFMVFIVLFTVIYGRVWCGWACPQTIFMEMVFRRIEYWIEGDAHKQRKLNDGPWTRDKFLKKTAKFSLFAIISFLIGNLVMAYIVGIDELKTLVTHPPAENWGKFIGVVGFSGIFFFVFAYFREQACIAVCPYGRLQGVMLGKDSVVVAYDHVRGEPRARLKKNQTRQAGDCIDCRLCVQVCPTGIDIRDGTQMECVNCTACIDACDEVMDKVGFERGLVRFASQTIIEEKGQFRFTPRILAYTAVLVGLLSILGFSLMNRSDVETTVLRTKGMMFQRMDDGYISNLYNLQIVNKTTETYSVGLSVEGFPEARVKLVGKAPMVPERGIAKSAFFVEIPEKDLRGMKNSLTIVIKDDEGRVIDQTVTTFLGPAQ